MASVKSKSVHESFVKFFENPTRESLRGLLKDHMGELRNCDFKESWPSHASVSKHLLALGNAGGGCLIVGVKENDDKTLAPVGVSELKDKADINNGVKPYLPSPLFAALEMADFPFDAAEYGALVGKRFQIVFVHPRPEDVPFVAQRGGDGIRSGAIYVRREAQTEEATHEEVQRLLDERLAASPQTAEARGLKEHLEELKVLYAEIPREIRTQNLAEVVDNWSRISAFMGGRKERNPMYPPEDYQSFVRRMLDEKKNLIERLLGHSRKS